MIEPHLTPPGAAGRIGPVRLAAGREYRLTVTLANPERLALRVLDTNRDRLRNVGSVVQIVRSPEPGVRPAEVFFDDAKITIVLGEADLLAYAALTHAPHLRSLLATTLVLPALVEAVHRLRADPEAYDGRRWADVLTRRNRELNLTPNDDPLLVAQRVYDLPVRRAFQSAQASLSNPD